MRDFLEPGLPPQSPKLTLFLHFLFQPEEFPGGHYFRRLVSWGGGVCRNTLPALSHLYLFLLFVGPLTLSSFCLPQQRVLWLTHLDKELRGRLTGLSLTPAPHCTLGKRQMSRASVASSSGFGIGGLDKSLQSSEPNLSVQDKDETPGKNPKDGTA